MNAFDPLRRKVSEDVDDNDLAFVANVIALYPQVERAYLFGSRARGQHRYNSDLDIGLVGDDVTTRLAGRLQSLLEGSHIPQRFDVLAVESLDDPAFRRHILDEGILLYDRATYRVPEHLTSAK